ncbi:MAG: type IV secretion system protein VirB10 [Burkholderiaceae bacterium]|nr:type IV secretion system protein VirB10 [Burkholderiaceae bacterium]
MSDRQDPSDHDRERREEDASGAGSGEEANTISPLPGETGIPDIAQRQRIVYSRKGLLGVGLLILLIVAVLGYSLRGFATGGKKPDDGEPKRTGDKPAAATAEPRKLELPARAVAAGTTASAAAASAPPPRIPALVPTAQEAEPIGVRRTGTGSTAQGNSKFVAPEDAPVLLVTTRPGANSTPAAPAPHRPDPAPSAESNGAIGETPANADPNDPLGATARNLEGFQRRLQGLLETLTRSTAQATQDAIAQPGTPAAGSPLAGALLGGPSPGGTSGGGGHASGGGLFGGQLQGSATPKVAASTLGNRSLTLPKGTAFTCALKTKVISATSGLVGCQVQRNVFSDDGRVLLIERGSHLDGEYRIASVRPGTVRIPVLWTRIRTPLGVTVDIDSPGTGQLGESGIDGHVDNRWGERIGAAMLLSLIDDSVKLVIQNQANETSGSGADTIVLPSTTANTSKLAEKVLDSTVNIPPLIYQNQGGIVGIYVARDVDFSTVYELRPTPNESAREGSAPAR